jgi:hypothetical protein
VGDQREQPVGKPNQDRLADAHRTEEQPPDDQQSSGGPTEPDPMVELESLTLDGAAADWVPL